MTLQQKQFADFVRKSIDDLLLLQHGEEHRSHLGASEIGHKCERYLWYKFRWFGREKFNGRMLRLFERGQLEEKRFVHWLKGAFPEAIVEDTLTDQKFFNDVNGHFGGSPDGFITINGRKLLLEFKTSGTGAKFNSIVDDGVEVAKPMHYAQMCVYGYKHQVKEALYFVINKNDDDLCVEVVDLDHDYAQLLINKATDVVTATTAPPRISENPSWYGCKYCPMQRVCHFGAAAEKNCRSCVCALPGDASNWICSRFKSEIPKHFIASGCDSYVQIG